MEDQKTISISMKELEDEVNGLNDRKEDTQAKFNPNRMNEIEEDDRKDAKHYYGNSFKNYTHSDFFDHVAEVKKENNRLKKQNKLFRKLLKNVLHNQEENKDD